jgi:hypothetical protein
MNNFKIGDECYTVDNSYLWNKTKNIDGHITQPLAGTDRLPQVKVKVVSEPYDFEITNVLDTRETYEFIDVEYNGDIYRVLNHLTEKPNYNLYEC